jgi:hypothetical protein
VIINAILNPQFIGALAVQYKKVDPNQLAVGPQGAGRKFPNIPQVHANKSKK